MTGMAWAPSLGSKQGPLPRRLCEVRTLGLGCPVRGVDGEQGWRVSPKEDVRGM